MPVVALRDVSKTFAATSRTESPVLAIDHVDLEIEKGEIYGIIGYSGAGKSTLVRLVNALETATSGSIEVLGREIVGVPERKLRSLRSDIGMIFQQFNLFNSKTVWGNIEYPLIVAGIPVVERNKRISDLLNFVGLVDKAASYPDQLSGGQKQRVGIARALATSPSILLADEATSALDPETTHEVLALLRRVNEEFGTTIIVITHEMEVIKRICDSAALIENGRIVEQGRIVSLISTAGSRLAHELFPLGDAPHAAGDTVIDITFSGGSADRPVIAQLARTYGLDVSILGAAIETIGGNQAGRTRLQLPGSPSANVRPIEDLRSQGMLVEIVGE